VVDAQATSLILTFVVGASKFRRVGVPFGVFFTRYYSGKAIKTGFWQAGTQAAVEESKFLKRPEANSKRPWSSDFWLES